MSACNTKSMIYIFFDVLSVQGAQYAINNNSLFKRFHGIFLKDRVELVLADQNNLDQLSVYGFMVGKQSYVFQTVL